MSFQIPIQTHLKLHFEKMARLEQHKPMVLNVQEARMDFIQYCIQNAPNLAPLKFH